MKYKGIYGYYPNNNITELSEDCVLYLIKTLFFFLNRGTGIIKDKHKVGKAIKVPRSLNWYGFGYNI